MAFARLRLAARGKIGERDAGRVSLSPVLVRRIGTGQPNPRPARFEVEPDEALRRLSFPVLPQGPGRARGEGHSLSDGRPGARAEDPRAARDAPDGQDPDPARRRRRGAGLVGDLRLSRAQAPRTRALSPGRRRARRGALLRGVRRHAHERDHRRDRVRDVRAASHPQGGRRPRARRGAARAAARDLRLSRLAPVGRSRVAAAALRDRRRRRGRDAPGPPLPRRGDRRRALAAPRPLPRLDRGRPSFKTAIS